MTKKVAKGIFTAATLVRAWIVTMVVGVLNACGVNTEFGTSTSTSAPQLSVSYLDSTNGNAAVSLTAVSSYPGVGLFDLVDNCAWTGASPPPADSTTFSYTFQITNTGTAPLEGIGSTPVTVTLPSTPTTDTHGGGTLADYTVTVTQPTFPILPGESSTFTVTLNVNASGGNTENFNVYDNEGQATSFCTLGWIDSAVIPNNYFMTGQPGPDGSLTFTLAIQTNDPASSNFSTALTVFGQS